MRPKEYHAKIKQVAQSNPLIARRRKQVEDFRQIAGVLIQAGEPDLATKVMGVFPYLPPARRTSGRPQPGRQAETRL
jgi:hypothetical protein